MGDSVQTALLLKLAKGEVNLWDQDAKKSLPSALNGVLRVYYNNKDKTINTVDFGMGDVPMEVDHFLEVQHVVKIIMDLHPDKAHKVISYPLGDYLRLSQFLNHSYNLFRIPQTLNQEKKRIDFSLYDTHAKFNLQDPVDVFLHTYLLAKVKMSNGMQSNVRSFIWWLVEAMEKAQGEHAGLSIDAAASLREYLSGKMGVSAE